MRRTKLLNKIDENYLEGLGLRSEELLNDDRIREKVDILFDIVNEEKRRRALNDIFYLAQEILGYKDLTPGDNLNHPYIQINKMLERKDEYNKPFNLILMPRDTLKTTMITITKTIQRILRNPNIRILICNAVLDNARKMLHEIKNHLHENPKFIEIFGDWKGKQWHTDEITVAHRTINTKEFTIEIGSPEKTKTSKHYDLIIADDLVSEENIKTGYAKESIYKYFKDLLDLLDHPNGVIEVVGTRWDFGDLYSMILDQENNHLQDFNTLIIKPYNEKGEILFPRKLSKERLAMLKRQKGLFQYSAQYENDPVPEETAIFKPEYFTNISYDRETIKDIYPVYMLVDPANRKNKNSDYTAIVIFCVNEFNEILILDLINDRFSPGQLEDFIFKKAIQYNPQKIGIETVGFQSYVRMGLAERMSKTNRFWTIVELEPHGRAKEDRIRALEPLISNKRIKFPKGGIMYIATDGKESNMVFILKEQLLKFPHSKSFDMADCLAYLLDIISPNADIFEESELKNVDDFKDNINYFEWKAHNKEWQNIFEKDKENSEPEFIEVNSLF